jgi:hypothetical protein
MDMQNASLQSGSKTSFSNILLNRVMKNMSDDHAEPTHIRLLQDCAEICAVSADFMLRQSEFHPQTCQICADICEQCALSCEQMNDDDMMQACVDACRTCAKSCGEMGARQ